MDIVELKSVLNFLKEELKEQQSTNPLLLFIAYSLQIDCWNQRRESNGNALCMEKIDYWKQKAAAVQAAAHQIYETVDALEDIILEFVTSYRSREDPNKLYLQRVVEVIRLKADKLAESGSPGAANP